ncbi:hypothetical protein GC207_00650 [bacterium]|nr:hypothetical protein [bacterium]
MKITIINPTIGDLRSALRKNCVTPARFLLPTRSECKSGEPGRFHESKIGGGGARLDPTQKGFADGDLMDAGDDAAVLMNGDERVSLMEIESTDDELLIRLESEF